MYASAIFTRARPLAELVLRAYPQAIIGGSGWSAATTLADAGIDPNGPVDYSDYPRWTSSIGYSQRGCRLRCPFCIVPKAEGAVTETATIADIWRGGDHPRHVLLLDNDFLGQPRWRERITELVDGRYRVWFNQGINARLVDAESAAALASVDYRDDGMRVRRLYTAFDNAKDAERSFRGTQALIDAGVRPHHLMVYMLIGFWPDESHRDRDWRRRQIREMGALPPNALQAHARVARVRTLGHRRRCRGRCGRRRATGQRTCGCTSATRPCRSKATIRGHDDESEDGGDQRNRGS